jgi:lipopolysaccharide export LptBFGC system permease protein LptF
MTNLKKLMMAAAMMGILIAGFTSANAGILIANITDNESQTTTEAKDDKGVIVLLTGVIELFKGVIVL